MSKRSSVGPSNTLFKYFTKTPPASKKAKPQNEEIESSPKLKYPDINIREADSKHENKKRERHHTPSPEKALGDNGEDSPIAPKKRKRIRLNPLDSDDSDTENKADNKVTSVKEKSSVGQKLHDSFSYETTNSPKAKSVTCHRPGPTPVKREAAERDEAPLVEEGSWIHCKLDWLKLDKIRDAQKRRPDHPDYDPTTLYVPPGFYKAQTPAHRQWWEMKSTHFDCVLFFKVGKFYELYHMDAAVGVNELGFSYMKGEFAHSGFPESAYARMASTLVAKGYKVARVEQTETPDMMTERCKKAGKNSKSDKVVRREVCQVTVRGTQACGLQDAGPGDHSAVYLLAVAEEERQGSSIYGVSFVDTSVGLFRLGQFADDGHSSRLLTALARHPPALIVYDRKCTSARTVRLVSAQCASARRETRALPPPEQVLRTLAEQHYRTADGGDWPEGLKPFLHQGDALGLTPGAECSLAVRALGGCVQYLQRCMLDVQTLAMARFERYQPPDATTKESTDCPDPAATVVLDSITLRNLRIIQDEGCLYDKLNFCSTPMGKRLLYQWVCAPSCNVEVVRERQAAVKTLLERQDLSQEARGLLAALPDLERLLAKLHSLGNLARSKSHPDSRAIFYEEKTYSKRKVLDFLSVLNGLSSALRLGALFRDSGSTLLTQLTQFEPHGKYPDYRDTLKFFTEGFNQSEAEKEGRILPGAGVDPEYDAAIEAIEEIQEDLDDYRKQQERFFKCRVAYVGTDRKRYQLEVAQSAAARAGPSYQLEGARKGFKRFSTPETRELLARMMAAEEQRTGALKDLSRRLFERFSARLPLWDAAARALAALDVLLALAEFARTVPGDVCLPDLQYGEPFIKIVEGRHPGLLGSDFIPNDTELTPRASLLLLTGPNMGGKSTLMRQVALLTVLAHLGSYVPAQECSLSVVDRVFTRLGAADDILAGQSTFLTEMRETAAIVRHASRRSLVLLDELGRGTSTYDGTAIASGVCAELAARGCRTLFSTHYHALVHHLATRPGVTLGHMACMVETDESTPDSEHVPEETITFLYKLSAGACPKSYGFNAARLAGVPAAITRRARAVSRQLEREADCVRAFRLACNARSANGIRDLLAGLTI